ncbi:hypothetical protein [Rhodopirellula baltica]|uniref:Uncharacterized protein n=1 Tax=Rhodopirellula baltica SWK14 TaxID=993516 RepID=L7C9H3_RHOBT|nr:hypothetical protein [Rhodopirellula baltica]ELP30445.1 hypothetical protein RBSWK_05707 [Rhodopirellula baltica SWK14]
MRLEWIGCFFVAYCAIAGCAETQSEPEPSIQNIVEDESERAIQDYMDAQDQNSRRMAEQYLEQQNHENVGDGPPMQNRPAEVERMVTPSEFAPSPLSEQAHAADPNAL